MPGYSLRPNPSPEATGWAKVWRDTSFASGRLPIAFGAGEKSSATLLPLWSISHNGKDSLRHVWWSLIEREFPIHPGEEIRTPRMWLLFWTGEPMVESTNPYDYRSSLGNGNLLCWDPRPEDLPADQARHDIEERTISRRRLKKASVAGGVGSATGHWLFACPLGGAKIRR